MSAHVLAWRAVGLRAFEAGVAAVRPDKLVMEAVAVTGSGEAKHLLVLGESIPIPGGVSLIAFGKASILMARAAERKLGPALSRGVVIAQPSAESCPERCRDLKSEVHVGSRGNLPDAAAQAAAGRALAMAADAKAGQVVLVLISGGGSALLPLPALPLTLEDKIATIKIMTAAGASITQLNTVRKHLSAIKGGQLGAAAHPARLVALILSDVVGDEVDVIASGPTVPDPSTYADALAALDALAVAGIPPRVLHRLQAGARGDEDVQETPKCGDSRLAGCLTHVLGNNRLAAHEALQLLRREGYQTGTCGHGVTRRRRGGGSCSSCPPCKCPPRSFLCPRNQNVCHLGWRNDSQIWARRSGLGQGWAVFAHGAPCCASSSWSRQLVPGVGGH